MAVYLDFEKVEPRQLEDARLAIELFCAERVAARISEDEVGEIRAYLAVEATQVTSGGAPSLYDFHVLMARLTGNPALHLFVQTLRPPDPAAAGPRAPRPSRRHLTRRTSRSPRRSSPAMGALARHRMMTHLEEVSAASTQHAAGPTPPCGLWGVLLGGPPSA